MPKIWQPSASVPVSVLEDRAQRETTPDVVIADPARSGLGSSAAAAVASLRAPVVILVSCDPASLARDASDGS